MTEASAILALAHRDFIKLLRDRQRMVADFAFPLIFIGILGTSLQAGFGGQAGGINLLDYVFSPEMESMGRSDPKHPAFGLIAWGAISPAWMIANYGDDDARVILSTILASAAQHLQQLIGLYRRAALDDARYRARTPCLTPHPPRNFAE